ncbi:hypothetical protein A2856_01450 [Candidatus Uhrbacteria bacterium RIFCSPHIGHO2_01_FULL_63_20]|uniref:Glycosyltransferase RgtA/B/C/D-like domain-containing protein n=1 Tax=Candidatus Uhrbacteria bacterium RIFCSPHIGHO2_01_FULL_63_20 TaxID=1802385 RepID=A0A1F7TK58_9BACT|nr:MAG: hypothetical protein A2856_01450 [Candidatus Uhrbacteria bacterium RIFCSPHIGHO2_01_FULL_63_20]
MLIAAAATVAFFGSLVLLPSGRLFVSPDENANAFFARAYAHTGKLSTFEPLNTELGDALHPRSVVSIQGFLVPGGFLGIPVLYGLAVRAAGDWVLPFLTPLLAFLAVFAWYALASKLFGRRIGFVAALLLAVHPAWWYYTARSLMPNVPFVAFLIFALYVALCRPFARFTRKTDLIDPVVAGTLSGLALFVRASELVWIIPAAAVTALVVKRVHSRQAVGAFLLGATLVALPALWMNARTYGSPFVTGYAASRATEAPSSVAVSDVPAQGNAFVRAWERVQEVAAPAFPFGLHPRNVLRHVGAYAFALFWWLALLTAGGIAVMLRTRGVPSLERRRPRAYHAFALMGALYLAVLYGSWKIADNPDPDAISIANSYVRYWLPAFVLATPYAATALVWITERAVTRDGKRMIASALAIGCLALSAHATFLASPDGLLRVADTLRRDVAVKVQLLLLTEPDAVVITDRGDKLLFPDRRVRVPLRDEATFELMPRLVLRAPLYYYGITFPSADIDYLNQVKLKPHGLRITLVRTFHAESLYRIDAGPAPAGSDEPVSP